MLLLTAWLVLGAVPVPHAALAPSPPDTFAVAPDSTYRLHGGDMLEFRFPYNTELDFTSPVRPDGGVFFPYVGDVRVGGLSVGEAHDLLVKKYAPVLRDAEVFILLKEYLRPRVYVAGEVTTPGRQEFVRGMSVYSAIYSAGGYTDDATHRSAVVVRHVSPTTVRVIPVPLRPGKAGDVAVLLEPEDIVLVPKSAIANLDKFIRQYSRDLLPVSSVGLIFKAFGTSAGSVTFSP